MEGGDGVMCIEVEPDDSMDVVTGDVDKEFVRGVVGNTVNGDEDIPVWWDVRAQQRKVMVEEQVTLWVSDADIDIVGGVVGTVSTAETEAACGTLRVGDIEDAMEVEGSVEDNTGGVARKVDVAPDSVV
jgi:hypothetical protein